VLEGMLVRQLDDASALDELHTRISAALGHTSDATTWGRYKEKWLANVDSYAQELPAIRVVTPDELDRAEAGLAGTKEALYDSEAQRRKLEDQAARLSDAKSAEEVAEILLPEGELERFEQLRSEAAEAVGKLDSIVAEAMWYELFQGGMPWPTPSTTRAGAKTLRRPAAMGCWSKMRTSCLCPTRR